MILNYNFEELRFRKINSSDKNLLYRWRNLNEIVILSSTQKRVTWKDHDKWFEDILLDINTKIYIILNSIDPIGQVKFKKETDIECKIGIYLIAENIGKGMGSYLIDKSCKHIKKKWNNIKIINAEIRKENERSIRAFKKAGFSQNTNTNALKDFVNYSINIDRA